MKLVSIDKSLLEKFKADKEVLYKDKRPYVLILKLKYKNKNQDFAIPIRSNIPANAPKNTYFNLPPRKTTKPYNRHGIHYIKMFPVKKEYIRRYRIEGNAFAILINNIIIENKKGIIKSCQKYLNQYEKGNKPLFSTDIDFLLKLLNSK